MPRIDSLAEMGELIAAGDAADDDRVFTGRTRIVGVALAAERPKLMPLPGEAFDPLVVESRRVDQRARVSIRQSRYSVPARYAGRAVRLQPTEWERRPLRNHRVERLLPVLVDEVADTSAGDEADSETDPADGASAR